MNKLPFMKFYPADFILDAQSLSITERGIWITLLAYIWLKSDNGTVEIDKIQLESLIGSRADDWVAFKRLGSTGVAEIEEIKINEAPFVKFIVHSRRIEKDKKELKMNALYVSKHRSKDSSKIDVRVDVKPEVRDKKFRSSEVQNTEEKIKDNVFVVSPPQDGDDPTPEDLVNLWNEAAHKNLPRVQLLTESRKRKCNTRLAEHPEQEFWNGLMAKINRSPLLTGLAGSWKCTFDWILEPSNMTKILEGNYEPDKRR